jgi:hypothetical protein
MKIAPILEPRKDFHHVDIASPRFTGNVSRRDRASWLRPSLFPSNVSRWEIHMVWIIPSFPFRVSRVLIGVSVFVTAPLISLYLTKPTF